MYRYVKAFSSYDTDESYVSIQDSLAGFSPTDGGFMKYLFDESGNKLTLQITKWANGWDWLLMDSENMLVADSDNTTFETAQKALDDFNDWTNFNAQ